MKKTYRVTVSKTTVVSHIIEVQATNRTEAALLASHIAAVRPESSADTRVRVTDWIARPEDAEYMPFRPKTED